MLNAVTCACGMDPPFSIFVLFMCIQFIVIIRRLKCINYTVLTILYGKEHSTLNKFKYYRILFVKTRKRGGGGPFRCKLQLWHHNVNLNCINKTK